MNLLKSILLSNLLFTTSKSLIYIYNNDLVDINSNLNKYLAFGAFGIDFLPNAFEQNKFIANFIVASLIGASGAYVPIFTCAWYDSSVVSGVWQFAITLDGVKIRYNTSATSWSNWKLLV